MSFLNNLLSPSSLPFLIAIIAIIMGGVVAVVWMVINHQERMAMIDRGIHPDHPPEDSDHCCD